MRKRTLGVVLLAGLAISGSSAFTGSNTYTGSAKKAGYGSVAATGVTVTNVKYNTDSVDTSKLATADFTVKEDVTTGYTITMTLRKSDDTVLSTTTCGTPTVIDATNLLLGYKITCDNPDVAMSGFESVGLSVVSST